MISRQFDRKYIGPSRCKQVLGGCGFDSRESFPLCVANKTKSGQIEMVDLAQIKFYSDGEELRCSAHELVGGNSVAAVKVQAQSRYFEYLKA